MKIGGVAANKSKAIFPAPDKPLTFRRGNDYLAFFAQPVWDFDEFSALCPLPENTHYRFEKGGKVKDPDAPAYREALKDYARKRWGYLVLKSLEPSRIEWNTVDPDDPETWGNVEHDLRSILSHYEVAALLHLVDEANALDAEKLEDNAKSFFQSRAEESQKSSLKDEVESLSSSEPASDLT